MPRLRLGALGLELFELGFWLKNMAMPAVFRPLAFWLLKVDVLEVSLEVSLLNTSASVF